MWLAFVMSMAMAGNLPTGKIDLSRLNERELKQLARRVCAVRSTGADMDADLEVQREELRQLRFTINDLVHVQISALRQQTITASGAHLQVDELVVVSRLFDGVTQPLKALIRDIELTLAASNDVHEELSAKVDTADRHDRQLCSEDRLRIFTAQKQVGTVLTQQEPLINQLVMYLVARAQRNES